MGNPVSDKTPLLSSPDTKDDNSAATPTKPSPAAASTTSSVPSPHQHKSDSKTPDLPGTGVINSLLLAVLLFDFGGTYLSCIGGKVDGKDPQNVDPVSWGSILDFQNGTSDLAVLCALRLLSAFALVIPLRLYILGRQQRLVDQLTSSSPAISPQESPTTVAINDGDDGAATREVEEQEEDDTVVVLGAKRFIKRPEFNLERKKATQRKTNDIIINAALSGSFLLLTLCNCVTAVKCLYYKFEWSPYQEIFTALAIFWSNVELFLVRFSVQRGVRDFDQNIEDLHPHPLVFNHDVSCTRCDLCNVRIIKECFDCITCDFNVCLECFRKKNRLHAENLVSRGDKGIDSAAYKKQKEFSPLTYVLRGLKLMKPFWHIVAIALVCLVANQCLKITLPNFQGKVIDSIIDHNRTTFWHVMKLFIGLSATTLILGGLTSFCVKLVMRNVAFETRMKLFESIIIRDIAFFDASTTGSLTARMTTDTNAMVSPLNTLVTSILSNGILLIGALVMCLIVSWRLAMIAWTIVGPIIFTTGIYARWSRKLNRRVFDSLAEGNNNATQAFGNIRTVRSFSTERYEMRKYFDNIKDALDRTIQDALANAGVVVTSGILELGANAIILGFGGMIVMNDPSELTVGNLVTFQLYVNMMNRAYQGLDNVVNQFTKSAGAAERVLAMLDGKPDIDVLNGDKIEESEFTGHLEFKDVVFFYQMRANQNVLKGINVTFPRNSVTAIVGKSGAGKSTIMHLLLRYYDPKGGEILVDGRDMRSLSMEWLHHHTAVVAQDTQLFSSSIEDNICYGLENVKRSEMVHAAKLANAHSFIMDFPDGYDTQVGERGVRLSGGQRQRIAIARAFLRKPRILLLDEATSALDAESEAQVQQALDNLVVDLQRNCTIVIIAHRLSTVVKADKIVVLMDGNVAEEGTHTALLANEGPYYNLVSKQMHSAATTGIGEDDAPPQKEGAVSGGKKKRK